MAQANLKFLQPEKLAIDPSSSSAEDDWKFWFKTFSNFINALPGGENALKKLDVLTAHLTAPLYKLIQEVTTYERAIEMLQKIFVKPRNEIYAKHLLATIRQNIGESIDEFILRIDKLSQNCSFTAVTALEYKDAMKTDSFISGILSNIIRQRLLVSRTLTFVEAYEKAQALDLARISSESYSADQASYSGLVCKVNNFQFNELTSNQSDTNDQNVNAIRNRSSKLSRKFVCYLCGGFTWHSRNRCPAKIKICDCCGKLGHYAKCLLKRKSLSCLSKPLLASVTNLQSNFSEHVLTAIRINNIDAYALVDTGSTNSYLNKHLVVQNLKIAWSKRFFFPKLFIWHSSGEIVRMKQNWNRTKL